MFGLPSSTEFDKRIPKQKFYDNITNPPVLKRFFVEQIKVIHWKNKVASTTMNLAVGNDVMEIEVFELRLNQQELDESVLRQIDKEIPYHILFLLEYEGRYQARIGYKEIIDNSKQLSKVNRYYQTDWMELSELPIKADGLSMDAVYENFVRQIAGKKLQNVKDEEQQKTDGNVLSLRQSVEREEKYEKIKKEIRILQGKIRREKQLNKQMKLNAEVKRLRKEIEELR